MIVLINPFEVPADTSDRQFLAGWQRAADHLRHQPGFVSTTLHQAASPDARFRFINVAEWQSAQSFAAAVGSDEFRAIARQSAAAGDPTLYEVVRTITGHGDDGGTTTAEGERS